MLTQQGAFTVHVTDRPLEELPGCDEWLLKLVIPVQCVPTVRLALDVLGFRLADIFPDLFNLAREIKNVYEPARPHWRALCSVNARLGQAVVCSERTDEPHLNFAAVWHKLQKARPELFDFE